MRPWGRPETPLIFFWTGPDTNETHSQHGLAREDFADGLSPHLKDMKASQDLSPAGLRTFGRTDGFVMTGTLLALSQLVAPAANAPEAAPEADATDLPQMVVQADGTKKLYKPENLQSLKYTVPLLDVPQTVTVVPVEVIREQGASNLRDVLRNVPGISIQAGEGGQPPGDNMSIRGFSARSDLFVDGVRDFGGYSRDSFNIEQVEVTKGPSSTNAGRGSTGGTVNLGSKMPKMGNAYEVMLGGGTDSYGRMTMDLNQEIPNLSGTVVRLNAVYHTQETAGRDYVDQERWGVAPSITLGLGTDTRFTLSYFHLQENNLPDYGLPWVPRTGNITGLKPGDPGVSYRNWYGLLNRDHQDTKTDIVTAIYEHDFNENLKLRNLSRYGRNELSLVSTPPRFFTASGANKLPAGVDRTSVRRNDTKFRDETNSVLSNQTDLRYDFHTGKVKHELVGSLEFAREDSENRLQADFNSRNAPIASLDNPNASDFYIPNIQHTGFSNTVNSDTIALSLFDTVHLSDQWIFSGGVRYESLDTDFGGPSTVKPGTTFHASQTDNLFSYRAAITYKPVEDGSIYLGYGTSFNPTNENFSASDNPRSASYYNTDPEENRTIELGTKWELLDKNLLLTAALFRTDKTNARTYDPTIPSDVIALDGKQRVQGFEFGFTGLITENWRVLGGYTFLDSEVLESDTKPEVGNALSNTPAHTLALWSVHDLPKGFQVGLGTQYVGSRYNNSNGDTRQEAPSYAIVNALIGYQLNDNVSFRLNGYNLLDKDYIDQVGGGHFVPGAGRSVVITADIKF